MTNIVVANLAKSRFYRCPPLYQYNYGMVLRITGIDLPDAYQVDFANDINGSSITQVGNADGVAIPSQFFQPGQAIYCWLRVHPTQDSGVTTATIVIPISPRATITDEEPTPEEQSAIDQAIATLNNAVEQTAADVVSADASAQVAQTAQAGAETAELNAGGYAQSAQTYAHNAATAKDAAVSAKTAAETARTGAAQSAQAASESAAQAAVSAGSASQSATDAADTKAAVIAAKNTAESAAQAAEAAKVSAQTANTQAQTAATNAQASATSAAASKTGAETAASNAAQSAEAADAAKTDAVTAKTAAEAAASNADQSATDASESATEAAQSAQDIADIADGIAQEPTAQNILDSVQEIKAYVQQIAENGMGGGDLNGFSLARDESNRVVLSYTNPDDETDTATAILASDDTALDIVDVLHEMNGHLREWAERSNA